jgi:hypothetical protein
MIWRRRLFLCQGLVKYLSHNGATQENGIEHLLKLFAQKQLTSRSDVLRRQEIYLEHILYMKYESSNRIQA